MKLITIATYSSAIEAEIAISKLKAYDIPVFPMDMMTSSLNWVQLTGGIKLQVPENTSKEAIAILNSTGEDDSTFIDIE